jgi:hypothetical protein
MTSRMFWMPVTNMSRRSKLLDFLISNFSAYTLGKMGENGVRVQILTEIPAPLRSVHAKESPY